MAAGPQAQAAVRGTLYAVERPRPRLASRAGRGLLPAAGEAPGLPGAGERDHGDRAARAQPVGEERREP
eukprot:2565359-Pyramimonas_sp.AAC.1